MAAPHVAGAAALVWSYEPNLTALEVKERLIRTSDQIAQYQKQIKHSGRLNVFNALSKKYPTPIDIPESKWKDFVLKDTIETNHPYTNNFSQEWDIVGPATATKLRIVFERFETEKKYDRVQILDRSGTLAESVSGNLGTNYTTWYVNGNVLKLKFQSDRSRTHWGFRVLKVQYIE